MHAIQSDQTGYIEEVLLGRDEIRAASGLPFRQSQLKKRKAGLWQERERSFLCFYKAVDWQGTAKNEGAKMPSIFFRIVNSYLKGAEYGKDTECQSVFVWKIGNSDWCIDRIANLPGFCSDFLGNRDHLGCREGQLRSVDTGSQYHRQADRDRPDANRNKQRER